MFYLCQSGYLIPLISIRRHVYLFTVETTTKLRVSKLFFFFNEEELGALEEGWSAR